MSIENLQHISQHQIEVRRKSTLFLIAFVTGVAVVLYALSVAL